MYALLAAKSAVDLAMNAQNEATNVPPDKGISARIEWMARDA